MSVEQAIKYRLGRLKFAPGMPTIITPSPALAMQADEKFNTGGLYEIACIDRNTFDKDRNILMRRSVSIFTGDEAPDLVAACFAGELRDVAESISFLSSSGEFLELAGYTKTDLNCVSSVGTELAHNDSGFYTAEDFIRTDFPPLVRIINPWLSEANLVMIHGATGLGKTLFSLDAAAAIATGAPFLGFEIPNPYEVLYCDGEMDASSMAGRIRNTNSRFNFGDRLKIFNAASTFRDPPDLSTKEGQDYLEGHIQNAKVIFLDNLSAFCRTGNENSAKDVQLFNEWLIRNRAMGRTIVCIHHDNKAGDQRGSSKRLDPIDTRIHLTYPYGQVPDGKTAIAVYFKKKRHFWGSDAEPFLAEFGENGWSKLPLSQVDWKVQAKAMHNAGIPLREIESRVGKSKDTISNYVKKSHPPSEP